MICLVIVEHEIEINVLSSSGENDITIFITAGSESMSNPSMTVPIAGVISCVTGILAIIIAICLIVILR